MVFNRPLFTYFKKGNVVMGIGYITIFYLIIVITADNFTLTDVGKGRLNEIEDAISGVKEYIPISSSPRNDTEKSRESFDNINQFRQEHSKFDILWNQNAYNLAKFRADDMVRRGYFSHTTPDGKDVSDFIGLYNFYSYAVWGENICSGCNDPTNDWINSPGHREILLTGWGKGAVACTGRICVFIGVSE